MPEETFETPQTTPPVEPKSTDWTKIILAAVLGFGLLAGSAYAGYYYGTQQTQPAEEPTPAVSQPVSTPTPSPTPTQTSQPTPLSETFQQILIRNCRKVSVGTSHFYGIELDTLPVSIDQEVIEVKPRADNAVVCAGDTPSNGTSYAYIETEGDYNLNVYDENSAELGHGGPRFLGVHGDIIKKTEDITLTIYMGWSHGGPALVGDVSVIARGVKELRLSNGEVIFANTSFVVIAEDDPRLLEFLDSYSEESDSDPGRKEITANYGDVEIGVVSRFFDNLTNLENLERGNIRKLENILDAVTAR